MKSITLSHALSIGLIELQHKNKHPKGCLFDNGFRAQKRNRQFNCIIFDYRVNYKIVNVLLSCSYHVFARMISSGPDVVLGMNLTLIASGFDSPRVHPALGCLTLTLRVL